MMLPIGNSKFIGLDKQTWSSNAVNIIALWPDVVVVVVDVVVEWIQVKHLMLLQDQKHKQDVFLPCLSI